MKGSHIMTGARYLVPVLAVLIVPELLYAQAGDNPFASATASMKGIYASFIIMCRTLVGICGLITIFLVVKNMLEGDRDAMKKFLTWLIWLAISYIMFSVLLKIF